MTLPPLNAPIDMIAVLPWLLAAFLIPLTLHHWMNKEEENESALPAGTDAELPECQDDHADNDGDPADKPY